MLIYNSLSSEYTMTPHQLLELALRSGAEAAEVYYSHSSSAPVFFEANQLKQLEFVDATGTALRLWRNGKPGLVVAYGAYEGEDLVDQAVALSNLQEPEEICLNSAYTQPYKPTWGEPIGTEALIDQGKGAIAQLRGLYPEVLCSGQWECSTSKTVIVNSRGLDVSFEDTSIDAFLSGELVRGDDFLQVYASRSGISLFEFSDLVERLGQYLGWAERNVSAPQGNVPVLFTAKCADLFWSVVSVAMSGKQVEQKSTPWLEKLGSLVVSDAITVQQLPEFDCFYLPFDDEGTATQPFTWIDRGVLQDFYTDRKLGRELNLTPRGNGYRSLATPPKPSLFNAIVAPGESSLGELIATIGTGILVDQVLGGGAGISGDFSVNIELGYRIENGQIVGRVKDTMVAGNVYRALQHITLGNDREWHGSLYTPAVLVAELAVSSRAE